MLDCRFSSIVKTGHSSAHRWIAFFILKNPGIHKHV